MDSKVLAERITKEIERKGIMKKDLGSIIGASDVMISYWCNGKRVPLLQQIVSMAEYFGVSVDYLVGLSDAPHRAPTLADDLELSDYAMENLRSIAGEPEKKEMLNRLLSFSGLSSVLADIVVARRLRREAPISSYARTIDLSDKVKSEVNKAGYVLLDHWESADYLEEHAMSHLKLAFKLHDGRIF